jgi:UDP-glucuronate decarboxylase
VATTGLKNTLEVARANQGCRVAFFSSSEIYGDPDKLNIPTRESFRGNVACLGPRACYDMSKRLGETLVQIYHQQFGVAGTIIRPFNVYGPGMQKTDYRVLPNFAARLVEGKPLQIYGRGDQTRTFCYVTDAIGGFLRVLTDGVPGEPYNIGNPSPEISMTELAIEVARAVDKEKVDFDIVEYPDTYPADEPSRRCPDISKATQQLGYAPRISLDEGLKRFFSWTKIAYQ